MNARRHPESRRRRRISEWSECRILRCFAPLSMTRAGAFVHRSSFIVRLILPRSSFSIAVRRVVPGPEDPAVDPPVEDVDGGVFLGELVRGECGHIQERRGPDADGGA